MPKPLTTDQRRAIAEKFMEWGNLVFAGLIVGQAFSPEFHLLFAVLGLVGFGGIYALAILFMRGGER